MVDRETLKEGEGKFAKISWDSMIAGAPEQKSHRRFPFKRVPPKAKAV